MPVFEALNEVKAMNDINRLDRELMKALRREEPPAGFAERVLREVSNGRRHPRLFHLAAAAAIIAAIGGGLEYRAVQRERAEGEAAKARVVLALQIAGSKLQLVQSKITRMHEDRDNKSNQ
jgi:hypothetical protein